MAQDIKVPIELATFRPKSPQEEVDFFKRYPDTEMPYKQWERYYCSSVEHRGFHCSSCVSDEDYLGVPNYDDRCCCRSTKGERHDRTEEGIEGQEGTLPK